MLDPFKIWFSYNDYYLNSPVTLNRDHVCFNIYQKNKDSIEYDSFILGSSRSLAFNTNSWKSKLKGKCEPFHFDASGEGVFGINNKLKFLDQTNVNIKNVLIVLDEYSMKIDTNQNVYFLMSHPELSGESKFEYYSTFLKASLDLRFIVAYLDYKIFKKHRPYFASYISKFEPSGNTKTGDFYYDTYEQNIKSDSISFYNKLINNGVFYNRIHTKKFCGTPIQKREREQLNSIAALLKKHGCNYKIVVSPMYEQIPLSPARCNLLDSLFGKKNIYNFSGVNDYTNEIGNYYENIHFRPAVAESILNKMYTE